MSLAGVSWLGACRSYPFYGLFYFLSVLSVFSFVDMLRLDLYLPLKKTNYV